MNSDEKLRPKAILFLSVADVMEVIVALRYTMTISSFNKDVAERISLDLANQLSGQATEEEIYQANHQCNINTLIIPPHDHPPK